MTILFSAKEGEVNIYGIEKFYTTNLQPTLNIQNNIDCNTNIIRSGLSVNKEMYKQASFYAECLSKIVPELDIYCLPEDVNENIIYQYSKVKEYASSKIQTIAAAVGLEVSVNSKTTTDESKD